MPHQLWHCNCQLGTELYSASPDRCNECLHKMPSLQGASGLPLSCAKMFSLHVYVQHLPRFLKPNSSLSVIFKIVASCLPIFDPLLRELE